MSFVLTLQATDADISSNGEVWYSIETDGIPFIINIFTGEVTTAAAPISLAETHYTMTVKAYDHQGVDPSLENSTSLDIYLYNYYTNLVILTLNKTTNYIEANQYYYVQ